ncbi:MarR family winged helix-turn-helix transcriptional regulator [Bosea vestrisii]|uniref:MarR family winged helix-turn-helix transcriptional regulator n=1 Tax=Bosea vestrisii TaxID=151416 RepID=UPI0024E00F6D|nr:MarR family winged helix-turn-helix transcriptional regulator [Bosea vestrisii]WID94255.1 MarR family winged helix-turn-helix transcriptional regulator [Bosea vestrisii]
MEQNHGRRRTVAILQAGLWFEQIGADRPARVGYRLFDGGCEPGAGGDDRLAGPGLRTWLARRRAEEFEGGAPCGTWGDEAADTDERTNDAEGCAGHDRKPCSFSLELLCSAMNKMQEPISKTVDEPEGTGGSRLPWELPRFKNWLAVARMHQLWKKVFSEALAPSASSSPITMCSPTSSAPPGLTQQALAEKLLVGRSAMSMLLPELERRGLIERRNDDTDRRVRRLWLTPEGETLTRKALAIHTAKIEAMMGVLNDEECNTVGEMMWRVVKYLER